MRGLLFLEMSYRPTLQGHWSPGGVNYHDADEGSFLIHEAISHTGIAGHEPVYDEQYALYWSRVPGQRKEGASNA